MSSSPTTPVSASALDALLDDLAHAIRLRDGSTGVQIVHQIEALTGRGFAEALVNYLIAAGRRRAQATTGTTTR